LREVFADTAYWIALTNPIDQYHQAALRISVRLKEARIITTDAVLTEYLNAFADKGVRLRQAAVSSVDAILSNPTVRVLPQSRKSFIKAFALYRSRLDKGYSLTDCLSMIVMRERRIPDALTTDRHFEQEGFIALMIEKNRS